MAKELIEYIREIRKVAGSQVGVHFGAKSPYHIQEILRICEAAEQSVQSDGACAHAHLEAYEFGYYCKDCGMANPPRR
jgi:hypothetical protein